MFFFVVAQINCELFSACGRKIVTGAKKQNNLSVTNKSQTLPRNLGSKAVASASGFRTPNKPTATPPVIRRTIVSKPD